MKLSIIIPVYNEIRTILMVIKRVQETPFDKEIIIVDDGSTDGTRDILIENGDKSVTLLFHESNQGKGRAIRTAIPHITGDIVIIQDADMEYHPSDYPHLLAPFLEGKADAVYGSRFLGGPHRVLFFWHWVANKLITTLSNMLTNLNLSDIETGYKAFKADVIKRINIESKRFGFEPEITAKVAKLGCRIYEVPISYWGRDYSEGKKIGWKDGVAAIYWVIKYNLFCRNPTRTSFN